MGRFYFSTFSASMKHGIFIVIFSMVGGLYGQSVAKMGDVSNRYFEDQFYLGVTYNFVRNIPEGFKQQNLSYGLQAGVIKDIPLNSSGRTALGLGLGLALNNYYSNLIAAETSTGIRYSFADNIAGFQRSKIETHLIEVPLEFRWRNSTLEEYRFWRLYAGVKVAYVMGARSKSLIDGTKDGFYNKDIARFQYGPTINVGYNTFNIHLYYAISGLFKDEAKIANESIGFGPLRIGVIFYIL